MQILSTGEWVSVEYDTFSLDSEAQFYTLHVSNTFFGLTTNILTQYNGMDGMAFTTYDADHDKWNGGVCGTDNNNAGFWFNNCFSVCLTCIYGSDYSFSGTSLSRSNMMMKRV